MTTNPLWSPNNKDNNLNKFRNKYIKHLKDKSYKALHDWSILKKKNFGHQFGILLKLMA